MENDRVEFYATRKQWILLYACFGASLCTVLLMGYFGFSGLIALGWLVILGLWLFLLAKSSWDNGGFSVLTSIYASVPPGLLAIGYGILLFLGSFSRG